MFADDISLVITGKTYIDLQAKTQKDLALFYEWLKNNRLVLNYSKSNYVLMGNPRESSTHLFSPSINGFPLKRVFYTKNSWH